MCCVQSTRDLVQHSSQSSYFYWYNATSSIIGTLVPVPLDYASTNSNITLSSLPVDLFEISQLFFAAEVGYPYHFLRLSPSLQLHHLAFPSAPVRRNFNHLSSSLVP